MIELKNVYFEYPDAEFQLSIKQLNFEKASKTAIIGTSGYGKTTMLNLIAGIISPLKGEIRVKNQLINELNDTERRNFRIQNIGFIFQDFKLIPYLNLLDNVLLPFRINKSVKIGHETAEKACSIAEELGIQDKLKKFPSKLSQGEKQRVAICRALLNNPSVILADEPTGNLDPGNKEKIMEILFQAVEKFEATLITVTHDHEMLRGFEEIVDFKIFQKTYA